MDSNKLYDKGEVYLLKSIKAEEVLNSTTHEADRQDAIEQIMCYTELARTCFQAMTVRKYLSPKSRPTVVQDKYEDGGK